MDNEEVVGEIVGCDSLFAARILEDSESAYRSDTPFSLAPLGEVKHDPKVSSSSSNYDDVVMFNYYSEAGEDTLTISGASERRKAEITGKSYDPTTGRIYDSGDLSDIPDYAVGYRISLGGGKYLYRWLLKGNFSIGATTAKSKGEKVEAQGTELTFNPLNTIHKWTIPDPKDATKTIQKTQKAVTADTTDPNFTTADSWFDQVQTPTAGGAISALSVTAVPADKATGVLATAKPVLTFNNRIKDYSGIVLFNGTDNAQVPFAAALDDTAKILTLTPTANLLAGKEYDLVLSGVTDTYGQKLGNTVITFTTAAS